MRRRLPFLVLSVVSAFGVFFFVRTRSSSDTERGGIKEKPRLQLLRAEKAPKTEDVDGPEMFCALEGAFPPSA